MKITRALIPIAAVFSLGFGLTACDDGFGEEVGEDVDEAFEDAGEAVEDAADEIDDEFDRR